MLFESSQGCGPQPLPIGSVKEDQIEGVSLLRQAGERFQDVARDDGNLTMATEDLGVAPEQPEGSGVPLDEDDQASAARGGFDAEGPGASEEIEDT